MGSRSHVIHNFLSFAASFIEEVHLYFLSIRRVFRRLTSVQKWRQKLRGSKVLILQATISAVVGTNSAVPWHGHVTSVLGRRKGELCDESGIKKVC